jgi:radical SAM protein (TIGR01212 family)
MVPYNSYRSYLKNRFGQPVLKIPLNAGFSCPNRDGAISSDGCSFCDNRSFSPVAEASGTLISQLDAAIIRDAGRHKAFIAYLQPFSNTYGNRKRLESAYEPLVRHLGVVGLAVGTRPDCFTSEIYDYLADLAGRTYLSVEIGLQSASEEVLLVNRRGHGVKDFTDAVKQLAALGIETVAHVMIGLPPESNLQALDTAKLLASLPVSGVKIHQLMVIEGTRVHEWYKDGAVKPLTLEEYADILCGFLAHLRPSQHIHRIMADSSVKNGLVAPLWSSEKSKSMRFLHEAIEKRGVAQGAKQ